MITVEWREEFNTGVTSVDFEHQELVGVLNQLLLTIQSDGNDAQTQERIADLYGRFSGHFALEETVMKRYDYDEFELHKEDHEDLLDQIRDLMEAHAEGDFTGKAELFAESMYDWFSDHFQTKDSRLHKMLPEA